MKYTSLLFTLSLLFLGTSSFAQKYNAKTALKVLKGFCNYVPSGNAVVNGDTVSVQGFYMSETEMTNLDYLEFLYHLKKTGDMEKYEIAKIDTTKWNTAFNNAHMEPMTSHYHDHPAYRDYPVVNISREGAELYCQWLTEVYDSISGGELSLKFRIPTRAEYIRAARGDDHQAQYAWKGTFLRNAEGNYLANFVQYGDRSISRNKETGQLEVIPTYPDAYYADGTFIIAKANSYWPNEFGIYNMNGNVSEMVSDGDIAVGGDWRCPGHDVRIESYKDFNEPHPTVGFRVVATYLEPAK